MTTKEMAIAVLDYAEKLESERAALAAFASSLRDSLRNQPDWKTIAADPAVRETVHAKFAELRESILLASEDDSPLILLRGLTGN
jgi:hypothetical protein